MTTLYIKNSLRVVLIVGTILILNIYVYGQNKTSSSLFDRQSKKPIEFASIGIPKCGIGTSSDKSGKFKLEFLDNTCTIDSVLISVLGYENIFLTTKQIQVADSIFLDKKIERLKEVVILGSGKTKPLTIGNKRFFPGVYGDASSIDTVNSSSVEIGIAVEAIPQKSVLRSVNFNIRYCKMDSVRVKVNIYNYNTESGIVGELIDEYLLKESLKIKKGWNKIPLATNSVILPSTCLISLEIRNSNSGLTTSFEYGGVFSSRERYFYRYLNNASWENLNFGGVSYYIEIIPNGR